MSQPPKAISKAQGRLVSSASAWAAPRRFLPHSGVFSRGFLLRWDDRQVRRRKAEVPDADAFRRKRRRHPDGRGRVYQEEAVAGRDLHLPRRAARLLLRRARELPQRSRRPRLEAHTGIPVKAYEEIARAKQAFLHVVAGRMPGHLRFRTTVP